MFLLEITVIHARPIVMRQNEAVEVSIRMVRPGPVWGRGSERGSAVAEKNWQPGSELTG
jgi:hypothetical protein